MEFQGTVHEEHANTHTEPYIHYKKDKYNKPNWKSELISKKSSKQKNKTIVVV